MSELVTTYHDNSHSSNEEVEEDSQPIPEDDHYSKPWTERSEPERPDSTVMDWRPRYEWTSALLLYIDMKGFWYCPKCPMMVKNESPEKVRGMNYSIVKTREDRTAIQKHFSRKPEKRPENSISRVHCHLYPHIAVANGEPVAYFLNPLATQFCLNAGANELNEKGICGFDRLSEPCFDKENLEIFGRESILNTIDPSRDSAKPFINAWQSISQTRYREYKKRIENVKGMDHEESNIFTWNPTWPCLGCCVSWIDLNAKSPGLERFNEYAQKITEAAVKSRGWEVDIFKVLPVWNGSTMEQMACYINTFDYPMGPEYTESQERLVYICNNKKFGYGPEQEDVACGWQYGGLANFKTFPDRGGLRLPVRQPLPNPVQQ